MPNLKLPATPSTRSSLPSELAQGKSAKGIEKNFDRNYVFHIITSSPVTLNPPRFINPNQKWRHIASNAILTMKVLTNNYFHKQLERFGLGKDYLGRILDDIAKGRSVPLGGKLYKIRAAGFSKGKSGGFRNIFFWQKDELIVFCVLFTKADRENIEPKQFRELAILAKIYEHLNQEDIYRLMQIGEFREVVHDQEEGFQGR